MLSHEDHLRRLCEGRRRWLERVRLERLAKPEDSAVEVGVKMAVGFVQKVAAGVVNGLSDVQVAEWLGVGLREVERARDHGEWSEMCKRAKRAMGRALDAALARWFAERCIAEMQRREEARGGVVVGATSRAADARVAAGMVRAGRLVGGGNGGGGAMDGVK